MLWYKTLSKISCVLLLLVLFFCFIPNSIVIAAEYMIEKDGAGYDSALGYGRNIDGNIYVPLRLLFEATSAEVDYQPVSHLITIRRADGATLTMCPGDKQARIKHLGENKVINMPVAARLINGTTYVPIRFAAENLMCAVKWDNVAKKVLLKKQFATTHYAENNKRYTLDFGTAKLYELNEDGDTRLLGQPQGMAAFLRDNFGSGWNCIVTIRDIQEIPGGCVLLDWNFDTFDSQMWTIWRVLLTPDGQHNRSVFFRDFYTVGNRFNVYVDGADLWWPETERVLRLDGITGKVLAEYNYQELLAAMPQAHDFGFAFCDGEYMLLTYQQEANMFSDLPALVNLKTGEITDLFTKLIPKNEHADFHNDHAAPSSSLQFVKAIDGTLYFNYRTMNWNEQNTQREKREVAYRYK